MSDIQFNQAHQLSQQDARAAAQNMAARMAGEMDMQSSWEGDVLRFAGSGLSGSLQLEPSQARLEVSLGLLMQAFKPMIEAKIAKHMKLVFSPASNSS